MNFNLAIFADILLKNTAFLYIVDKNVKKKLKYFITLLNLI